MLLGKLSLISWGDILVMFVFILIFFSGLFMFFRMTVVYKEAHKPRKDEYHDLTLRKINAYESSIDGIIRLLRLELNAFDVYIGRFHNGGSYANGVRMTKFSIPYSKASMNMKELVRDRIYDKFTSHWPEVFDELFTTGEYFCYDLDNCKDSNFVRDMKGYEFKSVYMYLICQPDPAKTPEAFLTINYNVVHPAAEEERDRVKQELPRLLALMNLVPYKERRDVI